MTKNEIQALPAVGANPIRSSADAVFINKDGKSLTVTENDYVLASQEAPGTYLCMSAYAFGQVFDPQSGNAEKAPHVNETPRASPRDEAPKPQLRQMIKESK